MAFKDAYIKGFRDGFHKGTITPSKRVIHDDLRWIYGMTCLKLHERGWNEDDICNLMVDIQNAWTDKYMQDEEDRMNGIVPENVPSMVLRITGVDLVQIFGGDE